MDERVLFLIGSLGLWAVLFGISLGVQRRVYDTVEHWTAPTLVLLVGHAITSAGLGVVMLVDTGLSVDLVGQSNSTTARALLAFSLGFMVVDLVVATALRTTHTDTYMHHGLVITGLAAALTYDVCGWEAIVATVLSEGTFCFYLRRLLQMLDVSSASIEARIARVQFVAVVFARGIAMPWLGWLVCTSDTVPLAIKVPAVLFGALGLYWVAMMVGNAWHRATLSRISAPERLALGGDA